MPTGHESPAELSQPGVADKGGAAAEQDQGIGGENVPDIPDGVAERLLLPTQVCGAVRVGDIGLGVVVRLLLVPAGIAVSIAAAALGASLIEKHVTLRRADGGPDAAFSLEPEELKALVAGCREAFAAVGEAGYERKPSEQGNIIFRRSLYVVEDVAAGTELTDKNVRSIRPGFGLAPKFLPEILGKRAARALTRGTPLAWDMVSGGAASKTKESKTR